MKKLFAPLFASLFLFSTTANAFFFVPYWHKRPVITFKGCDDDGGNLTTYTAPVDQDINVTDAALLPRRLVIVGIAGEDGAGTPDFSIASATMNGVAMTEVVDSANASSLVEAAIYIGNPGPTDTVADFTYTFSEAIVNAVICWWVVTDLINPATATDTASAFNTASTGMSLDLNVRAYGVAVGMAFTGGTGATVVSNWTAGLTEQVDTTGAESDFSTAQTTVTSDNIPLTVTQDWDVATEDSIGVTASFR